MAAGSAAAVELDFFQMEKETTSTKPPPKKLFHLRTSFRGSYLPSTTSTTLLFNLVFLLWNRRCCMYVCMPGTCLLIITGVVLCLCCRYSECDFEAEPWASQGCDSNWLRRSDLSPFENLVVFGPLNPQARRESVSLFACLHSSLLVWNHFQSVINFGFNLSYSI